jgi:hypothetical protein
MLKRTYGRWGLKDGEGKPKTDLWRRIVQEAKAHEGLYSQVMVVEKRFIIIFFNRTLRVLGYIIL